MIRKSIFLLLTSLLGVMCFAQESHVFIKGGVNIANVSVSDDGKYNDANALVSFHAGVGADLPLCKFFAVQPALLFTGKGAKTQSGQEGSSTYFKATSNPYYVELPVNLVVKIPFEADESSFFFGAGPYIAMGVAGKNKTEGKVLGTSFNSSSDIEFSNDDPSTTNYEEGAGFGVMKRFDYGLNGTAGFQFKSLIFSANYGYGLAKLTSGSNNNNDKNKHRVLSFSVGIRL